MQKAAQKLEKLFFLFLLINPLLDVLSGAYIMLIEVLSGSSVSQFDMPMTPIAEFEEKGKTDPMFAELDKIVKRNNGLWCAEAEAYLLAHAKNID